MISMIRSRPESFISVESDVVSDHGASLHQDLVNSATPTNEIICQAESSDNPDLQDSIVQIVEVAEERDIVESSDC